MTRVLCVGDIHVMDRAPVNATESYTDDIIEMLRYTAQWSKDNDVDLVVWAGDIFHHKQPSRSSHALVLKMLEIVRLHESLGVELRIVIGNHDISNDVLESVPEKQPLGVLLAAGARELDGWHETLPVFGVPWQQRWLHEGTPWAAFDAWRNDSWRFGKVGETSKALAVTHAPIYPQTLEGGVKFDLVPTAGEHGLSAAMGNQGYLYYGHIHEDHGVFEIEGVTYANMGALSRGSLHEYNLDREIKAALWTEDGFTEVPIPHKPAAEAFKIDQALETKAERLSLDEFLSDVGTRTLDISSTATVIEHLRTAEVPPKVRARAIEIMENVE